MMKGSQQTLLIKIGGSMAGDDHALKGLVTAVKSLQVHGYKVAIVHGGGKDIDGNLALLSKPPQFVEGLRVTDAPVLKMVEMTLSGYVNKKLVKMFLGQGTPAVGISSVDAALIEAKKKPTEKLDLGFVGDVETVNPELIRHLWSGGYTPVISPVSWGGGDESLNVNADVAASEIANALQVDQLLFVSDVPGVLDDGEVIPQLTQVIVQEKIETQVIQGGMIPKVQSCLDSIDKGIEKVHIVGWKSTQKLIDQIEAKINYGSIITK